MEKKCLTFLFSFFLFLAILNVFTLESSFAEEDLYAKLRIVKPKVVKLAPLFTLKGLDGKEINLVDYKGKVILLNFWATWCVPCREEMPAMQILYNSLVTKGFEILAVSIDRRIKDVKSFVDKHNLTFPVLLDQDQSVRKKYFIKGLPTSFLINHEGKLIGSISGERDWSSDDAVKLMNTIIQESNT